MEIKNLRFQFKDYEVSLWDNSVFIYGLHGGIVRVVFENEKIAKIYVEKEIIDKIEVQ